MLIVFLYSIWIAYTVLSLSAILGVLGFGYWAEWENKKTFEKLQSKLKDRETEEDDLFSPNQSPDIK